MNTILGETFTTTLQLLGQAQSAHTAAPQSTSPDQVFSGTILRELLATGPRLVGALRQLLADTNDPRLALELAATAKAMAAEATRLELVAADRAAATAAHTLDQAELDTLLETPPDTTQEPDRASGRSTYKNPAEVIAAWTQTPYSVANRQVLDAQDLIGRRDPAGTPVPPRFEHLSSLFLDPEQNPSTVRRISRKLANVEPADTTFDGTRCTPTLLHADGRSVEEHAAQAIIDEFDGPAAIKRVDELIRQAAGDPDTGTHASLRRGLFRQRCKNPLARQFLLRTDLLEGERIDSLIAHANNPRTQAGKDARINPQSAAGSNANPDGQEDKPDFVPDGAESARWDDEGPHEQATPPERALNALMHLVHNDFWVDDDQDSSAAANESSRTASTNPDQEPLFGTAQDPDDAPDAPDGQSSQEETGEYPDWVSGSKAAPERSAQSEQCAGTRAGPAATGFAGFAGNRQTRRKLRKIKRIRPQIVAHMYLKDLRDLASAHAETAHGTSLPPAALRQLLCEAEIIPAVFDSDGALLDYGTARRFAPDILQQALLARDYYCIVPGCNAPVEHLEFHHVIPFSEGGKTSLDNMVPCCRSHHIELDFSVIKVVWRRGLPWVLLPKDRDPRQRLWRNYVPPGLPPSLPLLEPV